MKPSKNLKSLEPKEDELKQKLSNLKKDLDKNLKEAEELSQQKYRVHVAATKEATQRMNKDLEHQMNVMKQIYWSRLKRDLFDSSVVELTKEIEESMDSVAVEQLQKSFVERMDVRV